MLYRSKPYIVFLLVLITGLSGCQKSVEEISIQSDVIPSDSPLATSIKHVTAFDGSFDNVIDNSSCISVVLPVDVVVNNQPVTVNTLNEILIVESILENQKFDYDSISITFPIDIVHTDYSQETLTSQAELDQIKGNCVEGGLDADNECVDFNYPVTLQMYDSQNQRAATKVLSSDREFFTSISKLELSDIVAIDYPVTLTISGGAEEVISSNTALAAIFENNINTCDEGDNQYYNNVLTAPYKTGSLRIELTDAPFPTDLVAEANVVISGIEIKEDSEEGLRLIVSENEFEVNLLELRNGITASLVDLEVPEGFYNEIRLTVEESTVLLSDGTLFDLTIPSGEIKVKIASSIEIVDSTPVELLLDFDVSRSFVIQGNPNTPAGIKGFTFKPTIKAVNLAETGSLEGQVEDENSNLLEGTQISVFAADTLNTTTFSDVNGDYTILGLLPGDYEITAELDGYVPSNASATIQLEETTVVNFQLAEN